MARRPSCGSWSMNKRLLLALALTGCRDPRASVQAVRPRSHGKIHIHAKDPAEECAARMDRVYIIGQAPVSTLEDRACSL